MTSGDLTPEAAIPSRTVDDVATAHSRWWDGLLDEDVLALDTLLADDLTFHSPGGRVMTKAHFLDGLRSGRLQYDSITAAEPVIRLHGDTAIVTGRVDIQLRASGQPVAEGLYYTGSVRRVILTRVMPVGALLFDFHNTLVHLPRPVADEQWHEQSARQLEPLLRTWGAAVDGRRFARQLLTRARRASDAAATLHVSPDFAAIIRHVARDAGLRLDEDQVRALWRAWHVGGHLVGEEPYPDARATLTWAKHAGYRLGLVTNRWFGRVLLEPELQAHGLAGLFDAVVVSCDVGYAKPHPAIFRRALAALGLPAAQAVMVGDSLGTDVAGARCSGLRAVWKRNHRPQPRLEPASGPDAVIDDLWELRTLPVLMRET